MGLFKKRNPPLTRDEALACIPVKSASVTVSRTADDMIRLCYPLAVKPWIAELGRRFGGRPDTAPSRQLELDELGSLTWELIDGERSVEGIVREFVQRTRVHPKEAEVAVTRFLRELGRRGVVGMAPAQAAPNKGGGKRRSGRTNT